MVLFSAQGVFLMGNTGDGLDTPLDNGRQCGTLTEMQRANLAKVNARLGVDDFANPNMADTPAHLAEHGFVFKGKGGTSPTTT